MRELHRCNARPSDHDDPPSPSSPQGSWKLPEPLPQRECPDLPYLRPARLRGPQSFLGPLADLLALPLRDHGHDPDHHLVSHRHVSEPDVHGRLIEPK